jgi:hypothetical protein
MMSEDVVRSPALHEALTQLFSELVNGTAPDKAWMLNRGDKGLMRSLDRLSAADVSHISESGGSPIAAHADHLRYGLSVLNRWSLGENSLADADYTASWRRTAVNEDEWTALRRQLRSEIDQWLDFLRRPRDLKESDLNEIIGSIAHLAYHLGAIRQINRSIGGPQAID